MLIRAPEPCVRRVTALVALAISLPAFAASDPINGTWVQLAPTGTAPPLHKYFTAVYDPIRQRLVADARWPDYVGDTWALSLTGSPAWTQLWPGGTFERAMHAGTYDPPRDRMLIFGGSDGYPMGYINEVREMPFGGSPTWNVLGPAGTLPAGRVRHTAVYDPVRDRMIVFGGTLWGAGNTDQVWELSLSGTPTWTQLTTAGGPPSPRNSHSAIYDPVRDVMLVFGGYAAAGKSTEVWQLALSGTPTWTQVATVGTPPDGRSRHAAIYDPERDRMVVFGGYTADTQQANDAWELSLSGTPTWTQLAPSGGPPAAREGHEAIYDAANDRMVVYGGQDPPEDLWALNFGSVVGIEPAPIGRASLMLQTRPNPAAAEVTVEFSVPREGAASLTVYDLRGRSVRDLIRGPVPAGTQRIRWDRTTDHGTRASAGVYFLSLRSESGTASRRFLLID